MRLLFLLGLALAQVAASGAPGDRYFGRLRMSALRIRYETMQLKKRYENHQVLPGDAEHLVGLTEEAYRDWARQYPRDSWLPSTGYALAQLYEELPGAQARDRAVALLSYVKSQFAKTSYATLSRSQLHRGVTIKPYPAWAAKPKPTPSPSAAPSPISTPTAAPSATPA